MSSIPIQFVQRLQKDPDQLFAHCSERTTGQYYRVSNGEFLVMVSGFAQRFYSLGIHKGSTVAIWSSGRLEWLAIDLAMQSLGAVVISFSRTESVKTILQNLKQNKVGMLIVEEAQQYLENEDEFDEVEQLVHFLSIEQSDQILPLTAAESNQQWLLNCVEQVRIDWSAVYLYRSNVSLTHQECLTYTKDIFSDLSIMANDRILIDRSASLDHVRFLFYQSMISDLCFYFGGDERVKAIQEIKPTILISTVKSSRSLLGASDHYFNTIFDRWYRLLGRKKLNLELKGGRKSKRFRFQVALAKKIRSIQEKEFPNLRMLIVTENVTFQGMELWSLSDIDLRFGFKQPVFKKSNI